MGFLENFDRTMAVYLRHKARNLRRRAKHSNPLMAAILIQAAENLEDRADRLDPYFDPFEPRAGERDPFAPEAGH